MTGKHIVKTIVAVVLAVSFVAAAPLHAEARPKKHGYAKRQAAHEVARRAEQPKADRYQEFIADRRPVGTSGWWEQMLRENRAGTCCN